MSKRTVLGRRRFLTLAAMTGGAVTLAACTTTPVASPTKAPEPTKAAAPAAPTLAPTKAPQPTAAPAATTAPAPTKAPEPTKPAAATAVPTKAPAAAATAPAKIGKQLIGKLEGPLVITDPAQWPKTFKEAPMLAELVKAGKLPPVNERVPQEPLVIKPVHEIGKFGGIWRAAFTGPGDFYSGVRKCSGVDSIFAWDYTGEDAVPNIAKGWKFSDGGKTLDVYLRKGMKWSDGAPFTADDFIFWFQDMYGNKDLVPTPIAIMSINRKPITMEKVDDLTVRYKCPDPYYMLADVLASANIPTGGQAKQGKVAMGSYAPAHYLKQFHPKYVPQAELDKKVKDANYDNWVKLFIFKCSWNLNPELPVLSPWKTQVPNNTPTWIMERNPYSIWVDTEGNQLPYLDRVTIQLAENLEVLNLRAIAGEYEWEQRGLELSKLPIYLENQQKGDYKVYLDPADWGGDMIIKFNLNYDMTDPEIGKWFNTADFRRALSIGIERDQLNEVFWLGTGTPSSVVPVDTNKFNPGPEYRTLWATYDPKKAGEMLDKLGLDKKDADGYRLRTDGKGRLRIELQTVVGQFLPYTQIGEMIREQWKKIGIDMIVKEVEASLAYSRGAANEQQLGAWVNDGVEHMFHSAQTLFPYLVSDVAVSGPFYAQWFNSGGTQGKEPPGKLGEIMDKWTKAFGVPDEERVKLGKEIWKLEAEEVFVISTVGLAAASNGVRVVKNGMGNVPSRQYNSPEGNTPAVSRPQSLFWKK